MSAPAWADKAAELDALILRWATEMPNDFRRRILNRREPSTEREGCADWTMSLTPDGYGRVSLPKAIDPRGRVVRVHRAVWLATNGPIPYGMTMHHHCYRRICSNVDHLSIETARANILDGDAPPAQHARKTHCPLGHPLNGPDADLLPSGLELGRRQCAVCQRLRADAGDAVVRAAHKALGLGHTAYRAEYGRSIDTVCRILQEQGIDLVGVLENAGVDIEDLTYVSPSWERQLRY